MNPLPELEQHGQSCWPDNLTRTTIETGELPGSASSKKVSAA